MLETIEVFRSDEASAGKRIDLFLSEQFPGKSRSFLQKLLEQGAITVSGKLVAKNYKLRLSDVIRVVVPEPTELAAKPEEIPLDILYEDNDLLVVNKPRGMVVHPAAGNLTGTLVNALLYHCKDGLSGINGVLRPGIVHRIDKDTSGLLIVAKTDQAHRSLAEQIKEHSFLRHYEAVVHGRFSEPRGTVDAPIGRSQKDRKKMAVTDRNSKNAVTNYKVLTAYEQFTHLQLRLETGRTHQIRVHMAYIGHPVAGDMVYGPKNGVRQLGGQCLHARSIGFIHPATGKYIEVESPLPDYFSDFLKTLQEKG